MKPKYDVFISYRRNGGYETAKHLYDLLSIDGYKVSFDLDTLRSGDFDTELLSRIDQCTDFILIIDAKAFDRTLEPNFPKSKDWLRCELSYALQKKKNIIPVFLSGISGFPNGLPDDVAEVTRKNGPQYNQYYFDDFYRRLKDDFLKSKSKDKTKRKLLLSIAFVVLGSVLFSLLWNCNALQTAFGIDDMNTDFSVVVEENEAAMSQNKAKDIILNVMKRHPIIAFGYEANGIRVVSLLNEDDVTSQHDISDKGIYPNPKFRIVVLMREAGVWKIENSVSINMNVFYDKLSDSYNLIEDHYVSFKVDKKCQVFHVRDNTYLYVHISRSKDDSFMNVILEDFIAIELGNGSISTLRCLDNGVEESSIQVFRSPKYPVGIEEYLSRKQENFLSNF